MIKIHCIVLGRLKSKRLRKKCLLPLGEYNLTSFLIKRLKTYNFKRSEFAVTFSTSFLDSDKELYENIKTINASYQGSPEDVINRMIQTDKEREINCDYFLRVTADNPFTCPEHIQFMIDSALDNINADYISIPDLNTGLRSELIKASYLYKLQNLILNSNNSEYMTFMLNRPDKAKVLYLDPLIPKNLRHYSYTVDTKEQYLFVKNIVENGFKPTSNFSELLNISKTIKYPIIDNVRSAKKIPREIIKEYNCEWKGD